MKLSARRTVLAGIVTAGLGLSAFTSMGASAAVVPAQTVAKVTSVSSNPDSFYAPNLGYGQIFVTGTTPPSDQVLGRMVNVDITDTTTKVVSRTVTWTNWDGYSSGSKTRFSTWAASSVMLPTEAPKSVCGHTLSIRSWFINAKTKKASFSAPKTTKAYCGPQLSQSWDHGRLSIVGRFVAKNGKVQLTFQRSDTGATIVRTVTATGDYSRGPIPARAQAGHTSRFKTLQPFGKGCYDLKVTAKDLTTGKALPTLRVADVNVCNLD
jgi:hypothetical protein